MRAASQVEPNELRATLLSFLWVFVVMAAWYILRPVRNALSSDWSDVQLSWLWTSTFIFSAIAVSVYGAVISRVRYKLIVPGVYGFFALTFIGFYVAGVTLEDAAIVNKLNYGFSSVTGLPVDVQDLLNRAWYVWASVFGLFHLSVFWMFMSELFNKDQAKRLFGVIAVGAMSGSIAGPAFVSNFGDNVGNLNMLLISAVLFVLPIPIFLQLNKLRATDLGNTSMPTDLLRKNGLGVNPFSGFTTFVSNRYLLWIGLFILLYVTMSTFMYFEIRKPIGDYDQVRRAQVWANIDLVVNVLAAFTALFATGRLVTKLGMPKTLAAVPLLMVVCWIVVSAAPAALTLFFVEVVRRAGNYAVTRPGREVLFTLVDSESRYKAKPVIDTVVYRGGDVVTAWFYTGLTTIAGFGLAGVAAVGAVIATIWASVGLRLGGNFHKHENSEEVRHGNA